MLRQSDSQQPALRRKIGHLIGLLVRIEFSTDSLERAFATADRKLIGGPYRPGQKQSAYATTFHRLFGFRGNARKYLGTPRTRPTLNIDSKHIACICKVLSSLGFDIEGKFVADRPSSWDVLLDHAVRIVEAWPDGDRSADTEKPPLISHPSWRFVERRGTAAAILGRLKTVAGIALVGMPGIGKTVLARQVAAKARSSGQAVIECNAAYWLRLTPNLSAGTWPGATNYVGLWAELLREIATLPRAPSLSQSERERFRRGARLLIQRWRGNAASLGKGEEQLLDAIEARPSPSMLAEAIIAHGPDLRTPLLVADIAGIIRFVAPETLVVVDNVLNIEGERPTVEALFGKSADGRVSPLRLIVTSQRSADNLAFLVGAETAKQSAKLVDFQNSEFARRVVAAWGAPREEDLTREQADGHIDLFHVMAINRDVEVSKAINPVIAQVGGHALALAALASVWRYGGHKRGFWKKAFVTIQEKAVDLLHLQVLRDPDGVLDPRHGDVLQALRLAWSLLDDGRGDWQTTRDRFLDLAITLRGQPIDENVFVEFWKRVRRGPNSEQLTPEIAAKNSPLRRLEAASFVQASDGQAGEFALHDLHRILIEHELGNATALSGRHRDFLRAFGMLRSDDTFYLDEERHFAKEGNRTVLWPQLGSDADVVEIQDVGRYLLETLPHHVRSAAVANPDGQLAELVTTYRFLQARLDFAPGEPGQSEKGNVQCLISALDGIPAGPLRLLRRVVRMAGEAIAQDRRQLAGQLLARIRTNLHPNLERLRSGASRHAATLSFIPRFPFLTEPTGDLIASLPSPTGVGGAVWIVEESGAPEVLAWSGNTITVWNPDIGAARLRIDHGSRIDKAKWIANSPGGAAILSWSWGPGTVGLWDARTGKPRTQVNSDGYVDEALWLADAPGGAAILGWSRYDDRSLRLWDGITGRERLRIQHRHGDEEKLDDEFGVSWFAEAPDGPAILTWSASDSTVCLWDAATGKERIRMSHEGALRGAAWIPNALGAPGILTWSADGVVCLWNSSTGTLRSQMSPAENDRSVVTDVAASAGARWIEEASTGPAVLWWSNVDRAMRVWDAKTGNLLKVMQHDSGVFDAQWISNAPGGALIFSRSNNTIHLWDAEDGNERMRIRYEDTVLDAKWVADALGGHPAILCRLRDSTVCLNDAVTGQEITRIPRERGVTGADWVAQALDGPAILVWSEYVFHSGVSLWDPALNAASPVGAHAPR